MGWTNDQLNNLYIYKSSDGTLLLSVDEKGFLFDGEGQFVTIDEFGLTISRDPDDGSSIQIASFDDGSTLFLEPQFSVVPGAVFTVPGTVVADENVITPGVQTQGYVVIRSPSVNDNDRGELIITGDSNTGGFQSEMQLNCHQLYGYNRNIIGNGTVDTYPGLFTTNFTTTQTIFDYCRPNGAGVMTTDRSYEIEYNFSFSSTNTGDSIGLRIYSAVSATSLTGAVLIYDAGTFNASFTQMSLKYTFNGLPGRYIVLAGRRSSGTGTCTGFGNYRKLQDVGNNF